MSDIDIERELVVSTVTAGPVVREFVLKPTHTSPPTHS
jgi:hypothetical protein